TLAAEAREQVREIHVVETRTVAAMLTRPDRWRTEIAAVRLAAQLVVGRALLRVFQRLPGLADFLEARLGARLLPDVARVVLRRAAIRFLDVVRGRAGFDAERGVIVGVLHRAPLIAPPSPPWTSCGSRPGSRTSRRGCSAPATRSSNARCPTACRSRSHGN